MALGDLVASILSRPSVFVSNHLDVCSRPAADNVDFGNDSRRELDGASSSGSAAGAAAAASTVTPSLVYLPQTVVFCKLRHDGFEDSIPSAPSETDPVSKWRSKDRMKTSSVALVLCLNISVDPSDVIKISPCARMECWIDPFSMAPPKALETIGKTLLAQYEQWQPRARYKYQLDPTMDEVKKLCNAYRKSARSDRVLFHYNGHGVPKPTANGEIWLFNKSYTQYIPLPVSDLDSWLKTPSIYVFDCSAAGMIVSAITEHQDWNSQGSTSASSKDCIILAACEAHETLPQSPEFPGDVFTACLTTPIKMALQWYCTHSLLHDSLKPSDIDKIPGRQNDRKTLLGELNWIFTAVTDTIAWNVLPRDLFQRLFRQDLLVASLFRNFLLAERVMRAANCSPVSFPVLPLTHRHHMWDVWDMAAEICLSQLKSLIYEPNTEFQPSPFFTEQLTAFEVWLDHGSKHKKRPEQLPIVLQVLLSHSHRFHALVLLGRFLDMGSWAVDLALSVGIFPCVLKLLQTTAMELRQILVFIWAKILAFDKSCQVDLVKDGGHIYFIKLLESMDAYPEQRAMAAFVLAVIVNGHRCGQEACIQANLINVCLRHLQLENLHDTQTEPLLVQWLCLCLGKLWEDFPEAQMVGLRADAPAVYAPLLAEHQPEVRASAVFALGTLLDIGSDTYRDGLRSDGDCDDDEKNRTGWNIVKSILKVVSDGSPLVRAEVAVALARFARGHNKHLKSIAETFWKLQSSSLLNSLSSFGNIRCPSSGCTGQYMEPAIAIPSQIVTLLRSAGDRTSAGRDGRVSTSSPLASSGMMYEFPLSDDSSQHSDLGIISKDAANNGFVAFSKLRILDNAMYTECVLAMYTLAKDPSPRVASLGRRVLSIIGIEQVATKTLRSSVIGGSQHRDTTSGSTPSLSGLVRSSSWFDLNAGMRRVCSLEFMSHQFNSPDGLADPLLGSGGSSVTSDRSLLPQSTVYHWSCGHFSQPLLTATDDNEGVSVRREEREKFALDCIVKCQHSSVGKLSNEVAVWDTKFEMGTKAALLHPFSPVVIAADDCERIRIWNYEEAMLLNSFDNHDFPNKGISKLCLANELDDSLLLIASSDGNIRVWKDYSLEGKEKLVTAFSSIPGRRPGVQNVHAVVDWQQQSGYLYASGEISSIILWDLDKEQLFSSIPSSSDSSVSVLSASQVHGGQFAAGYADGSVRLFDFRAADMLVCTMRPHNQVERVAGIGFQPGFESSKIVSASQAGDIQFMDIRSHSGAYCTIDAYRGSIAALAIHPHAPIIASGSAKQIIEVFNLEGERLSIICYHPTFMAQKIGPVSCLTFHPYRVLLATGATDPCLSIYTEDGAQSR